MKIMKKPFKCILKQLNKIKLKVFYIPIEENVIN